MKVTALVSAYYAEEFLGKRLENLLSLTPRPEILVICQSLSREEEIARQMLVYERDKILLTINIPTLYEAWNRGIYAAAGEYLTSANCDDLFYPDGYAAMIEHLDTHDCALVCGDCDLRTGTTIQEWKRRHDPVVTKKFCSVGPMPMWRKSLHAKHGMFDSSLTISGDYEYWLRLATANEMLCHIDQTVGLYWKRADSIENRSKPVMHQENDRIRERYGK